MQGAGHCLFLETSLPVERSIAILAYGISAKKVSCMVHCQQLHKADFRTMDLVPLKTKFCYNTVYVKWEPIEMIYTVRFSEMNRML